MTYLPVNADCFWLSLDELIRFFKSDICPVSLTCSMREFGFVTVTNNLTGEIFNLEVNSVDE